MNINWTDVLSSVIAMALVVGPPLLTHHKKIGQIITMMVQIGEALNGRGIAPPVIDPPDSTTPDNPRAN